MATKKVQQDVTPKPGGRTVWQPGGGTPPPAPPRRRRKAVPKNDRFHDENGKHRTAPPPNAGNTWAREMRQHVEGHGLDEYVASLLKGEE